MTDIWQRLKGEECPILLYGTGNGADKILDELNRIGVTVSGVFASDGFVRQRFYRGFPVMSLNDAEKRYNDFIALFSFGSNRPEVLENIKNIMKRHTLIAPEVPVAGGPIFNSHFAKEHKSEIEAVYNMLFDEQSKTVFRETLLFKLDGDINRLFTCETNADEPFSNILNLGVGSSFLDIGAYNGDTVLDFINRVGTFSHITAVEPDPKNFKKLSENVTALNVAFINAAIGKDDGTVFFNRKSSRGSSLGGDLAFPCRSVDSIAKNTSFDYIKFDVEGAEAEAIAGAKMTIKRDKPKMRVAAYHRSEDYFTLPLKILEINPDYKVYMRHSPAVPAWDTDFFFVL